MHIQKTLGLNQALVSSSVEWGKWQLSLGVVVRRDRLGERDRAWD